MPVNLFDALLLALFLAAAAGGFRLGFVARTASWLGMAVGVLLAARLARAAIGDDGGGAGNGLVIAMAALVGGALAGQVLGLAAGTRLRLVVPAGAPRRVDRLLGAGAGVGGAVLAVWLLLPFVTVLRDWPAREAEGSAIAGLVANRLPAPPDTLRSLADLVGTSPWEELLSGSVAGPDLPAVPARAGIPDDVDLRVRASVVAVSGSACGDTLRGSGFVVADGLVVTNAHVVAGVDRPTVVDAVGSSRDADVVTFDSARDLAVLRAPALDAPALPIGSAERRDSGGVYGHPAGGELAVMPYQVARREVVRVPDLYRGDQVSERDIYFLASSLEEGDSGSPMIDSRGEAVGVAFAVSSTTDGLAFAVTDDELRRVLDDTQARLADDPGHREHGACLPGRPADASTVPR